MAGPRRFRSMVNERRQSEVLEDDDATLVRVQMEESA